jgi:GxxExxY protein
MIQHEGTKVTKDTKARAMWLSHAVLGAAIEVHRHLGPGLIESVYETALARELWLRSVEFERQVVLPLRYKGAELALNTRMDLVVERLVVVEVKSIERFAPIHRAQLLTYLRLSALPVGLLINFNTELLRHGMRRILNG